MRRKVGRGVQAQEPAGKSDHGDSEEVDKVQGRWARVNRGEERLAALI